MAQGGVNIVKRGSRRGTEEFNQEKLHRSLVSVCLVSGASPGQAESAATQTVSEVLKWLENRPEVTSSDLRRVAGKALSKYHTDAGYLYQQHRMTI